MKPAWKAIAAMSANRAIGLRGKIPWHLPEDLKFFRRMTMGNAVVMGRKTWESLGKPLPNRRNIVLSTSLTFATEGTAAGPKIVRSIAELEALTFATDVFVIGGEEIYRQLMPKCSHIYLTVLEAEHEGDAFFPEFEAEFPRMEVLERGAGCEWRVYARE